MDFALGSALFPPLRLSIGFRSDFVGRSDLKSVKIKRYKSYHYSSLSAISEDSLLIFDRTLQMFMC